MGTDPNFRFDSVLWLGELGVEAMDQDVPEGDDPAVVRNGGRYVRGILVEA